MRKLRENIAAAVDLSVVLMIGIAFAGMTVIAFIIWTVNDQITDVNPDPTDTDGLMGAWESMNASLLNITSGFDDGVNLLLVAITIFILAIAISALLMLRSR